MRAALREAATERVALVEFPTPTLGWNTNENITAVPQGFALTMDNFIAQPNKVVVRKGQVNHVTGFNSSETVESLLVYQPTGTNAKLFAATSSGVYNATLSGVVGAAEFAATNGRWQQVNFANSAGTYLLIVNGTDNLRYYDGSTWTSVATYGTINTNTLIGVAVYQQRLFFIEKNARRVLYLPAGAITGTANATAFNVEQIFPRGGYVQAIGTWTVDSGAGTDDRFVVITSEGEVAVFIGTDPSSVSTWSLIGVYYIGRPIGRRCLQKLGGDLLVLTDRGLFPLSRAIQSSTVEPTVALTRNIEQTIISQAASLFSQFGWDLTISTVDQLLILNVPSTPTVQYVMQLQTGGWSRFTGHAASCFAFFDGKLFYGTQAKVVQAMTGSTDFGSPFTAELIYAYSRLGAGRKKFVKMLQLIAEAAGSASVELGVATDFAQTPSYRSLAISPTSNVGVWDNSSWDQFVWGSGEGEVSKRWATIPTRDAFYIAPALKVTTATASFAVLAMAALVQQGSILV